MDGVITEYSTPNAEMVKQYSIENADLDSLREFILDQYVTTGGKIDLTKIPLSLLFQMPEFRETYKDFYMLKKYLDNLD